MSGTSATYRDRGDGTVEVLNCCKLANGSLDSVVGIARPPGGVARLEARLLMPARLEVSFCLHGCAGPGSAGGPNVSLILPTMAAMPSSANSRASTYGYWHDKPALAPADDAVVRTKLRALGIDLARVQTDPHGVR